MKKLTELNGRQYIGLFAKTIKKHICPIADIVNNCYTQFTKQDANYLCTKTFMRYFMSHELTIPWTIIVDDEYQEHDINNYVFGTYDIETILLFKISPIETIQITISTSTFDALVEYRKCSDKNSWYTVYNEYVSIGSSSSLTVHPKHKTILEYCKKYEKAN